MSQKKETGAENITWNLDDLYTSENDPQIEKDCKKLEASVDAFETTYKGNINTLTESQLKEAQESYENIKQTMYKLGQYSGLRTAIESNNPVLNALESKLDTFASELYNKLLFYPLELSKLSKATQDKH